MKKIILTILLLVSAIAIAQTNNPDKYTSITVGAGFNSTYQTFTNEYFPNTKWNRNVEVPMYYGSLIVPATDVLTFMLNYYYQPDNVSNFDKDVSQYRPTVLIHKQYSYSLAIKFYIK